MGRGDEEMTRECRKNKDDHGVDVSGTKGLFVFFLFKLVEKGCCGEQERERGIKEKLLGDSRDQEVIKKESKACRNKHAEDKREKVSIGWLEARGLEQDSKRREPDPHFFPSFFFFVGPSCLNLFVFFSLFF
jgi:hypothetical protein